MPVTPELALLFTALPQPYLLLSPELVIEAVSEAYLAATLTQREVLLGQYVFEAFPDTPQTPEAQSVQKLRASLAQVLATGQPHSMAPQHYDMPDPARPGQFIERHWQPLNAPVLDAQGRVVHLIHSVVDVTAEVQSQARLRNSRADEQYARAEAEQQRERFHKVLMQLPAHVATYHGPDHVYQFVNPPYQRTLPHRSFLGRPFREAMPESEGLGLVALFDQVYQTGKPYYLPELEGWFDFQDTGQPEQIVVNLSLHPLRNAQGAVDGVLDFSYDITAQVQARQQVEQLNQELETKVQARTHELNEQQRLLSQILAQVPAAITTLHGPEHRFTFANDRYQQLVQSRAQVGQTVAQTLPELAEQGFVKLLDSVYRNGQPIEGKGVAVHLAQSNGPPMQHYFDFTYQPMPDEQGQPQGVLVFVVDVTEQVHTRQRVQQLNEELQVANQGLQHSNSKLQRTNTDLDTFVYAASHDLRSPIVNIIGLLDLLRHQLPPEMHDPMLLRLVGMMEESITRFRQTVDHLGTIARLQNAPEQLKEEVELARVIDDIRLDLLPLLESTQATLQVDVTACPTLRFSPKDLRSILFNLISNAVKYHAPERAPLVQVRAQCLANQFVLEVQDNGLGLDEKQQGKLFAMFRRLHTHVEGSGVGLYLIKRLIENADGTISVHSQLGVGSTFTVSLPFTLKVL